MATDLRMLDWTLVQSFVAVAQKASLSGAARSLGQSQPTIGRHVKAMEDRLGVELFTRVARGLELTDAGQSVLKPALAMQSAAAGLSMAAAGQSMGLRGTVRITASEVVSHYLLPTIFSKMRIAEPEIQLELVPSDTTENLLFREADIAVRMYRPTQLEVVTKHVGDLPVRLYAAKSYLSRRGRPTSIEDMWEHDFVGFDRSRGPSNHAENPPSLRTISKFAS